MSGYGEKIGTITEDGRPRSKSREDGDRYITGKALQGLVIDSVLAGIGRTPLLVRRREGRTFYADVYAEPPLEEAEEAQRLGYILDGVLLNADRQFPFESLKPDELDSFTPAQAEQKPAA